MSENIKGYHSFDRADELTTKNIATAAIQSADAWIVATDDGGDDIVVNIAGDVSQLGELLAAITRQLEKIATRFEEAGGDVV